jgi:hypothetical protein
MLGEAPFPYKGQTLSGNVAGEILVANSPHLKTLTPVASVLAQDLGSYDSESSPTTILADVTSSLALGGCGLDFEGETLHLIIR